MHRGVDVAESLGELSGAHGAQVGAAVAAQVGVFEVNKVFGVAAAQARRGDEVATTVTGVCGHYSSIAK
jgi:hypothetical protein